MVMLRELCAQKTGAQKIQSATVATSGQPSNLGLTSLVTDRQTEDLHGRILTDRKFGSEHLYFAVSGRAVCSPKIHYGLSRNRDNYQWWKEFRILQAGNNLVGHWHDGYDIRRLRNNTHDTWRF